RGATPGGGDPVREALAKQIIAVAKAGVRDPERLCEAAVKAVGPPHPPLGSPPPAEVPEGGQAAEGGLGARGYEKQVSKTRATERTGSWATGRTTRLAWTQERTDR